MTAWARSGDSKASEYTQELLNEMEDLQATGNNSSVQLNSKCYNVCMHALAQDGRKESAERAEQLLKRMEELGQLSESDRLSQYRNVKANSISYTTVINCWARQKIPGAARRAEQVLLHMFKLYKAGNKEAKPDCVAFNTVLKSWYFSEETEATQKQERLLRYMMNAVDDDMKPDEYSFQVVLRGWAKSNEKGSAQKAQDVLNELEKRFGKNEGYFERNLSNYQIVINAWEKSGKSGTSENVIKLKTRMSILSKK